MKGRNISKTLNSEKIMTSRALKSNKRAVHSLEKGIELEKKKKRDWNCRDGTYWK